jgi:hypothetical protein
MNHLYTYLALQVAQERAHEAEMAYRATQVSAARRGQPSSIRRGLAHGLAGISRGTASVARRLDRRVAEDLGRSLAATE